MAELTPSDIPLSVDAPPPLATTTTTFLDAATALLPALSTYPLENPSNFASISNIGYSGPAGLAPKRHRRPSVRLGEIGDQSFDQVRSQSHRRSKSGYRFHKDPSLAAKSSKIRPLTNLVNGGSGAGEDEFNHPENRDDDNDFDYEFGSKKPITKKPITKRARTIWVSSAFKMEAAASNGGIENRDVDEPELSEQSPVQSNDDHQNMGLRFWDRRAATKTRGSRSESFDIHNNRNSGDHECTRLGGGVRDWLNSLGLGRYAPVFEIHEVDEEVLPLLTLEDLKDMGINAVGSRRKMYCGILKLQEGFS